MTKGSWRVYLLASTRRKVTYIGIAKDVDARLQQHNGKIPGGAKSTRAGRPWRLVGTTGPFANRSEAQIAESRLKQQSGRSRLESSDWITHDPL